MEACRLLHGLRLRFFHTSSWVLKDNSRIKANSANREARFLQKMIQRDTPKKKKPVSRSSTFEAFLTPTFSTQKTRSRTWINERRCSRLNVMFMEYITDIAFSGEIMESLTGKGIEITDVKVSPDYEYLTVFWVNHGDEFDEVVQSLLDSIAGPLRNELTQLYLISYIPKIVFTKDKSEGNFEEIERLLLNADMGDAEKEAKEKVDQQASPESIVMRQDILGFDHARAMEQVNLGMKKSSAPHRQEGSSEPPPLQLSNSGETPVPVVEERKINFKKFLKERYIRKEKIKQKWKRDTMERLAMQQEEELMENNDNYWIDDDTNDDDLYDKWKEEEKT